MLKIRQEKLLNIELLRIVSMIMIITLHLLIHGQILNNLIVFSVQWYLCWILEGICFIAVNCYILISGYFLCEKGFKAMKLVTLIVQTLFYSIVIYVILIVNGVVAVTPTELLKAIIPTISGEYWFVTVYIGLYVLSPYLNVLINAITKLQHLFLLITLFLLFSIIPTFAFFSKWLNWGDGNGIVWFTTLYLVAAYVRKYYNNTKYSIKVYIRFYLMVGLLVPISKFLIVASTKTILTKYVEKELLINGSNIFYTYNSPLVVIASFLFFAIFLNINIKGKRISRVISFFSPLTLGVYLIHENPHLRKILWEGLQLKNFTEKWYFMFLIIIVVIGIFCACSIIEYMRKKIFIIIDVDTKIDKMCLSVEYLISHHIGKGL